ncbi:MAG: hypothetical protein J5656_01250 [Clostridia bacterium]|nr:hypothetical protein [Clostridia bacterium]
MCSETNNDEKYIFTGFVKSIIYKEEQKWVVFKAKYPFKKIDANGKTVEEIIIANKIEPDSNIYINVPSEYPISKPDMLDVLKWNKDDYLIITIKRKKKDNSTKETNDGDKHQGADSKVGNEWEIVKITYYED